MAKRDGLKHGEGAIEARPSGSFQARWLDRAPDGSPKRRTRTFATREAAEDHLRSVYRSKRVGAYTEPDARTVAQVVEDWLARGEYRWKPSTYYTYRSAADLHVIGRIGELRAASLTTPRLQRWIDEMQRAGMSANRIHEAKRVLAMALKEAVQIGLLPSNPADNVRLPTVRRKEIRVWSADEIERATSLIDDPMWRAVYVVELLTGMRSGELRGLHWANIDLDKGEVFVGRTITRDRDGRDVLGDTTKTGRSRTNALPALAVETLAEWRREQARRRGLSPIRVIGDYVFTGEDGERLSKDAWIAYHKGLCRRAGVTAITVHQLRHTSATADLIAGTNPKIVAERLGHKNVAITLDIYSKVSPAVQRTAAESLQTRLFGARTERRETAD